MLGAITANKCVNAAKTVQEEMQCFHCQSFGHIATKCPRSTNNAEDLPTCSKCAKRHLTKDCKSDTLYCTNCQVDGHASNDWNCPTFTRKCEALNKRSLTNLLPFFPMDKDWTWKDELTNAPRWRPAPRFTMRSQRPNLRQMQINDWNPQEGSSSNQIPLSGTL